MGRGGARAVAIAALVGAAALLAGCGESRHANEQRPQVSTRVSVTINPGEVIVQPLKIAMGPEKFQESPQNQNYPEPPLKNDKGPLDVTFVAANQTGTDAQLKIRGGAGDGLESETVYARSPGSFQFDLPTGNYTITAVGVPEARPAHLKVGPYRASSQNDVLTP
ncbi:MAG TPA: hypothetical protein VN733_09360 [Solirubrobacterales bacterium]|nr:hypothetical protein [Solirubrobacterales bacterium]